MISVRSNLSKLFTRIKFKRIIYYDLSTFVMLYIIISKMRENETNSDVLPQVWDPRISVRTTAPESPRNCPRIPEKEDLRSFIHFLSIMISGVNF